MPKRNNWAHVGAGAGAGIATSLVVCPLDVVKIRIQGQTVGSHIDWRRKGVLGSLRHILTTEGFTGWYRGLGTTMFTYIPAMSVYFPAYSWAKQFWISPLQRAGLSGADKYHPAVHMAGAVSAGGLTNVATQPLWFIRTRQMSSTEPAGAFETLVRVIRTEGPLALYKGLGTSMFGIFHVIIQFPLYERLKLMQKNDRNGQSTPLQIFIASTISKVTASTVTYPHEVIRTRLQLQRGSSPKYRGIWHAVRLIAAEEGIRGFYGGLGINMVRVIPAGAITFITYEMILQWLQNKRS